MIAKFVLLSIEPSTDMDSPWAPTILLLARLLSTMQSIKEVGWILSNRSVSTRTQKNKHPAM